MIIARSKSELDKFLEKNIDPDGSIGLVPTMGALHEGHLSLVKRAIHENGKTVASLFVNPLQFNNKEDYAKYPNHREADLSMFDKAGVDCVYMPEADSFYANEPVVMVTFGNLERILEGQFRPGHFNGVGLVVAKLLHHVNPNRAYFGMKDLQQLILIKKMVHDLSFPTTIVSCETIRESSGLALSSRNFRLSDDGRIKASNIYIGLKKGEKLVTDKVLPGAITKELTEFYTQLEGIELEYCEVVNGEDLSNIGTYEGVNSVAICVAAFIEEVRLIDNLYLQFN